MPEKFLHLSEKDQAEILRYFMSVQPYREMAIAEKELVKLQEKYNEKIHVELEPLVNFYRAEDEHQNYLEKNPNGYCHIPKSKLETFIPA